jgi:hypothetical protein
VAATIWLKHHRSLRLYSHLTGAASVTGAACLADPWLLVSLEERMLCTLGLVDVAAKLLLQVEQEISEILDIGHLSCLL